jgi:TRAP-type C4-dicarboxylate transport system permease small subunit
LKRLFSYIDRAIEALVIIVFALIVLAGLAQVFNRYFLNLSLSWSEEFQRYGQIWLVFLAVPAAYRRAMHMGVEGLRGLLPPAGRKILRRIVDALWVCLGGTIVYATIQLMGVLQFQRSAGLGVPMHWAYGGILLGALYMILVGLRQLFGEPPAVPVEPGEPAGM